METWLRRVRAAIGMGLTWGVAWLGAGLVLLMVVGVGAADVPFPLFFGLLGFFAGITFSGILALVEADRRFDQMSLPRFAGWGAVGGLVLSVIFVLVVALGGDPTLLNDLAFLGPLFAAAGAASAAGSLALARMGEDGEVPDVLPDPDEAELTGVEAREPPGGG